VMCRAMPPFRRFSFLRDNVLYGAISRAGVVHDVPPVQRVRRKRDTRRIILYLVVEACIRVFILTSCVGFCRRYNDIMYRGLKESLVYKIDNFFVRPRSPLVAGNKIVLQYWNIEYNFLVVFYIWP